MPTPSLQNWQALLKKIQASNAALQTRLPQIIAERDKIINQTITQAIQKQATNYTIAALKKKIEDLP